MSTTMHSGFTRFEVDHLHLWGAKTGVEVTVVPDGPHSGEESAYIGLGAQMATWALYRAAGDLWLHRLDRMLWVRRVLSVEEATASIGAEMIRRSQSTRPTSSM